MRWSKIDRIGIKILEWVAYGVLALIGVFVFLIAVQILVCM